MTRSSGAHLQRARLVSWLAHLSKLHFYFTLQSVLWSRAG